MVARWPISMSALQRLAALDALDPVLDVVGRFGPLVGAGVVRRADDAPSGLLAILLRLISILPFSPTKIAPRPGPRSPSRCSFSSRAAGELHGDLGPRAA